MTGVLTFVVCIYNLPIILLVCLICDSIDWDDEIGADKSGDDETLSPSKESQVNEGSDEEESDEF